MLPLFWPETAAAHLIAAAFLGLALAAAWLTPSLFWVPPCAAVMVGAALLLYHRVTGGCIAWLLLTGTTIEMTLADIIGPQAFQTTIAVMKAAGIGLAVLCALRWGPRLDPFNPAWAFLAMAAVGLAAGLHPGLTVTDSLRSFAGSAAPFAFSFCLVPARWGKAMIAASRFCPLAAVGLGMVLDIAGVRPLFVDSGGARLAATGHPAFLAGVCLTAVYASLLMLFRYGRGRDQGFLVLNLTILVLTGARAPIAFAAAVTAAALLLPRAPAFPMRRRWPLLLAGAAIAPLALALSAEFSAIRLFNLLGADAGHLSGRELLWPAFESAAEAAPWFGWGLGAGNLIIAPDDPVARLLHTWAAHNEYLRIRVEGGWFGLTALVTLFILWVWHNSRRLPPAEALLTRLMFLALAGHAVTDNVLISSPASVLFTFAAAMFASHTPKDARNALPDSTAIA